MSEMPLSGVRVLDLTSVVVGPTATQWLGDYGAEIVKVEAPAGDLMRSLGGTSKSGEFSPKYLNFNRNKRSICLDLKNPQARAVVDRLLGEIDVVLANMRPAALKRLGLDAETVRGRHPNVIHCSISGFDQRGRYRDKPAYDTIIQGASGIAATIERLEGKPRYLPMTITDHIVGFIAVQCILLALLHRHKTGEGQTIEVPMFENMAAFVLAEHMGQKVFEGSEGPTGDLRILNPYTQPIETKDGWICVSANNDKQAFALFDVIGRPELKDDPRFRSVKARVQHVDDYCAVRAEGLKQKTTAEWLPILDAADIPAMPCHSLDSLIEDPQLADVGLFETLQHPVEGAIRNIRLPNRFSSDWQQPVRPAAARGADSDEILAELGFSEAERSALFDSGAVKGPPDHD